MNDNQPAKSDTTPETGQKHPGARKPPSDFIQGLVLFIAFIIFMAVWLHFNLPD